MAFCGNIISVITLKLILKSLLLFAIGLSIAIIIYPFLHETGHSFSALIFGAEIVSFEVLPQPSVACKMNSGISEFDFLMISFSGMLMPLLISLLLPSKRFWTWYAKVTLRLICIMSFVLGIVSLFTHHKGSTVQPDDIALILHNSPQYTKLCFVVLIFLLLTAILLFIKDFAVFNKTKLYRNF